MASRRVGGGPSEASDHPDYPSGWKSTPDGVADQIPGGVNPSATAAAVENPPYCGPVVARFARTTSEPYGTSPASGQPCSRFNYFRSAARLRQVSALIAGQLMPFVARGTSTLPARSRNGEGASESDANRRDVDSSPGSLFPSSRFLFIGTPHGRISTTVPFGTSFQISSISRSETAIHPAVQSR
jgi:hypothetical protein